MTNGKKWNIIDEVTSKQRPIFMVGLRRKVKKKMRKKATESNMERFFEEMSNRPFPFNSLTAITAQALSPYCGLTEEEQREIAKMCSRK